MSYETNDKMVSHPDHYKSGKYEVIDIIDEFTKDLTGTEAVCTANAIKYILRWKKKNGIQDVKKAIWYLQHLVDKMESRDSESLKTLVDKLESRDSESLKTPKEYDGPDDIRAYILANYMKNSIDDPDPEPGPMRAIDIPGQENKVYVPEKEE